MKSDGGLHTNLGALLLVAALAAAAGPVHAQIGLYHTYDETRADLEGLVAAHPTRAKLISIGQGWEEVVEFTHRQIWALKISDNVDSEEGEPEIVFVGNHHAREWISVEIPLAIAHHLLESYATDPEIQELVDNKVIWVIPMLNPDGHAYSVSTCRCWRKNRRNNGDGSFGVDPNRNYGYEWGGSGSSGTSSSYTYRGPAPFSEPETQALRDFLRSRPLLRAAVSYHNYTQAVLRPWSYTLNFTPGEPPPPGELMLRDLSDQVRARIQAVHGSVYKDCLFQVDRAPGGGCPSPHYAADGEFTDWVYHELNIPAFTIEVRPAFGGASGSCAPCGGFDLPESEIAPTVEENLPAALALIRYVQEGNVMIRDHGGDTGAVPSATLTASGWSPIFWASPDIWSDPVVPVRGGTATITARVHNLTDTAVPDVTVQIFYTDPRISLEFPSPDAVLLGEGTIAVPPGTTAEFSAPWSVPTDPNSWGEYHWCVGVVIKHLDDLPVSTHPVYSNNVAIRNFQPAPTTTTSSALRFEAVNHLTLDADLDVFVTTVGLPAGWEVHLDPDRPDVLQPGERYLGFAEVVIPEGSGPGEGVVRVHGALTPRRPGAANPVGSGIDYAVEYDPAGAGPGVGGPWWSVHLGSGFPVGSFDDELDPGLSATLDLELPISPTVSLLALLGYHSFQAGLEGAADLDYLRLSLDARRYFPAGSLRWFLEGGPGYYVGDPGPDDLGLNLGAGLQLPLDPNLSLEVALVGHWVDPSGLDRAFLDAGLGVKFRF